MSSAKDYPGLFPPHCPVTSSEICDWAEPSLSTLGKADTLNRHPYSGAPLATCEDGKCKEDTEEPCVLTTEKFLTSFPAGVSRWLKQETPYTAEEMKSFEQELDMPPCPLLPSEEGCCVATDNPFSDKYVAVKGVDEKVHVSGSIPPHVIVDAYWQNSDVLTARQIYLPVNSAKGAANVFGAVGMLKVNDCGNAFNVFDSKGKVQKHTNLTVPVAEADVHNVQYYGCSLIQDAKDVKISDSPGSLDKFLDHIMTVASGSEIIMMQYEYKDQYVEKYLTQPCGGGGYFVEHHDFPHIHAPMDKKAHGHIIIGKPLAIVQKDAKESNDPDFPYTLTRFAFTAFKIPFGSALYTPSNTLHGDGTLIGKYGITVANSTTPADTVLFYKDAKNKMKNSDLQMIKNMVKNT